MGEILDAATGLAKKEYHEVSEARSDFFWEPTDEPHATRRKLILAKYPEIKKLYGYCPHTRYFIMGAVTIQTCMAILMRNQPWMTFVLAAYVIGGAANHMCMMGMHELSHNLGFKKMMHNRIFSMFTNLPIGIPSAISFKRYHMEHHRYQGEDGIDVDVPTEAEGKFFNTAFKKLLFVIFQMCFYAIRPLFVNPKPVSMLEIMNYCAQFTYDALLVYFFGWSTLGYLLLSTLFAGGIHPVAGHFIAEHLVFIEGAETYSYYGILNLLTFNVGYHNEHHDFPFVPGSRLPQVRAIASEFYDSLPKHSSWVKVMYDYVMNPAISPFNRVKRKTLKDEDKAKLKSE